MITVTKLPETESAVQWPSRDVLSAQGEGRKGGQRCAFTMIPGAHTTPLRLSTGWGEKMNQLTKAATAGKE
jgi:hypothetical protein